MSDSMRKARCPADPVNSPSETARPNPGPSAATGRDFGLDFTDFYRREYHRVIRFLMAKGADRVEAEDAAQSAFVAIYERWSAGSSFHSPIAYVLTAAKNFYFRGQTVSRRSVSLSDPLEDPPQLALHGPEEATTERMTVRSLLNALPPTQANVLAFTLDAVPPAEIAAGLGITEATVRSTLRHARRKARWLLEREGHRGDREQHGSGDDRPSFS